MIERIRKDLIALRGREGQKELAERAGINHGKIQRFERGQPTLHVADMAAWLEACGLSMAVYFGRVAMTDTLDLLNEDADLIEKFKLALLIPWKRKMLKDYLEGLFADQQQRDKSHAELTPRLDVQPVTHAPKRTSGKRSR